MLVGVVACRLVGTVSVDHPPDISIPCLVTSIMKVDELEVVKKQENQTTGSSEWWRVPLSPNGVCAVEASALSVGGDHVGFHDECEVTDLRAGLSPVGTFT